MVKATLLATALLLIPAGCDYFHIGVQMLPREELPAQLDFGPIDDQAGHAIKLPDEPLVIDLRLVDPQLAKTATFDDRFTDYFNGVMPLDPLYAPAWLSRETLDNQVREAERILSRYGTDGARLDPLV